MPRVKVRYLLWLAEKAGTSVEDFVLSEGSLIELLEMIKEKHPGLSRYVEEIVRGSSELILLVNSTSPANLKVKLGEDDEIVIMPPVSGG